MWVIKTDNENLDGYFNGTCGTSCVSFSGRLDESVFRYETEQEALDEIDWLPEKAGPYKVEEVGDE